MNFADLIEFYPMQTAQDIENFLHILDYLPTNYRSLASIIELNLKIELSFDQMEHITYNNNDDLSNYKGLAKETIIQTIEKTNRLIIADIDGKGTLQHPRS